MGAIDFVILQKNDMTTSMTVWIITAVSVAAIIIGRIIIFLYKCAADRHHVPFEIGSERAGFWIPGDPKINSDDYDIDDIDDIWKVC